MLKSLSYVTFSKLQNTKCNSFVKIETHMLVEEFFQSVWIKFYYNLTSMNTGLFAWVTEALIIIKINNFSI